MNDQRSLTDQMRDLIPIANRKGLYDAADYIEKHFPAEYHRNAIYERPPMDAPPERRLRLVKGNDEA
jgi:hypothetical protein